MNSSMRDLELLLLSVVILLAIVKSNTDHVDLP